MLTTYLKKLGVIRMIVLFVGLFLTFSPLHFIVFANNDLLNQAFDEAKRYDYIINPGNTKDAVWAQVFNPSVDITLLGSNQWVDVKEPYLVRLTKLILRITIALSVSIIIFAGIQYMLSLGDEAKRKKAQNTAIYAALGILIWLGSLAIVELVLSITKSSIEF